MITGAAQMDGAILVVSAPDGPMPQTLSLIHIYVVAAAVIQADFLSNPVVKRDCLLKAERTVHKEGEGITSARSYTRKRRCVMADNFRII